MIRPLGMLALRTLRLYWRITKPVTFGARAVVVGPDGRLALVKHTYDRYWYIPGGASKKGEAPEAAVRREMKEEIGVDALAIERKLGTYVSTLEGKRDTIDVFVVRVERIGRLQRSEIAAAEWFAPDALPPDTSPATRRRIAEYLGRSPVDTTW